MNTRSKTFIALFLKGLFRRFSGFNAWTILLIGALFLTSCDDDNGDDGIVRIDKSSFSIEDQKDFGDNLQTVFQNSPEEFEILSKTDYATLYDHLEATFRILVQQTSVENREEFDWEVNILKDDSRAMAFCSPGGKFYIYTGLLKMLNGEDELVGLMSHEIHYANSGLAMDALVDKYIGFPFLLGDIFLGNETEDAIQVATYMRDYSYPSDQVMDGDAFAMNLVCPFQYNPTGLSKFLSRSALDDVDWIQKRAGNSDRIDMIKAQESPCGDLEEDPTFSERYMEMISVLP